MARTIPQIYDALVAEKAAQVELQDLAPNIDSTQQLLSDLDTPSRVARWRLMLWVVATAMWVHETLWDQFRAQVDAIVAAAHIGTPRWYVQQALAFQYGYALVDINGVFRYPAVVPAAQIVKRAAIVETGGLVILKVAKLDGAVVAPLTTGELTAFSTYIDDIRMAGTMCNIITDVPDLLQVRYVVRYDPLVLTPNGALITDIGVFPVEDAINAFVASLPFNGELVLTYLTDAVQRAAGVVNPILTDAQAKWGGFAYQPIQVGYIAHAGHMAIDPAFPLSVTLVYIPA